MDIEMTSFDCGQLCASQNSGVPFCCDPKLTIPVLFNDEVSFLNKKSPNFWQKLSSSSKRIKEMDIEFDDEIECFADCPGVSSCQRSARALVCRFYPFEPHCDETGNIIGITFNYDEEQCPLLNKEDLELNQEYINNSIIAWRYLFQIFPEFQELYTDSSQDLRSSKQNFKIFTTQTR